MFLGTQGTSQQRGGEAEFMVFTIEPCHMPSPKQSFHGKVKEADARAGLKTHTSNNLSVSGTRLIFQEDIVLK
jgi:hypothetical protein